MGLAVLTAGYIAIRRSWVSQHGSPRETGQEDTCAWRGVASRVSGGASLVLNKRVVVFSFVAAIVAFCVVQDRVTAAGARRYVALQRAALAGSGPTVSIDEVMTPAVRASVRGGIVSAAGVFVLGLAAAAGVARRSRRE